MNKKKMAQFILKFDTKLTTLETNIGILFYALMIVIILIGIFLRFVLRIPNVYGEELSMHCLFASTMVGISLGVRSRSHLGIEGFVGMLPLDVGKKVKMIVSLIVMMMFFFLCYVSLSLATYSMQFGVETASIRIPFYFIYFAMTFVFIISLLQMIMLFINDYILDEPILKIEGGGTLS